jgi:hypothetical protein
MRRSVRLIFAVLMLVTAVCSQTSAQTSAPAPAQTSAPTPAQTPAQNPFDAFQQFSASVSGGPMKWDKMKIYRSGNQMRADYSYEKEYRVTSLVKRAGWVIRPLEGVTRPKECRRMSLMDGATYPFFAYSDLNVERSPTVDKETINGHSCKVENYTVKAKDGGPITVKMKLWEAEDLNGFPIQIEIQPSAMPKFTLNYTDVSVERPDPKLFQLPALCRAGVHPKKKPPAATSKAPSQTSPKPPQ